MNLKIYTDGGSRGNPGPAAFGVVIKNNQNEILHQHGQTIGRATNNEAEYQGLISALDWLTQTKLKTDQIIFHLDSKLVVKQMQGEFKVKAPNLKPMWTKAQKLAGQLPGEIKYKHVYRDQNNQADALLNQALDKKQ